MKDRLYETLVQLILQALSCVTSKFSHKEIQCRSPWGLREQEEVEVYREEEFREENSSNSIA